jgi:hypothetical protein
VTAHRRVGAASLVVGLAVWLTLAGPGNGRLSASGPQVWELRPYRIEAQLVADWSPDWDATRLGQLAQSLEKHCSVEVGEPWRLTGRVASEQVRRAALALDWRDDEPQFQHLLGSEYDLDKVLIVVLRSSGNQRSVEVWEWDATADRWGPACRQTFTQWNELENVVLELMVSAVSELAVVKSINGRQMVLRPRGALLPLRNLRRKKSDVGSVFQLALPGRNAGPAVIPQGFLIVEQVDGTRLNCRLVSRYALELDDAERDSLIAIGAQCVHESTDLQICTAAGDPLVGCSVWLEPGEDEDGQTTRIGTTNAEGRVKLTADGKCRFLRVQIGDQLLDRMPVLPGHQPTLIWQTSVSASSLAVAQMFAACSEDLAVFQAQRQVYLARAEARKQAGKEKESEQLLAEMRDALSTERERLDKQFRQRRKNLADRFPQAVSDVDDRWSNLTEALR